MSVTTNTLTATPRTPLVILSVFVLVTLGLGWLVGLPLILMSPEERSAAPDGVYMNVFMLTPAVAAVIAYLMERRQPLGVLYGHTAAQREPAGAQLKSQSITDALGITPLRPVGRLLAWSILALLLFFAISLAALLIGAALGAYPLDLSMPIFVQDLSARLGREATEFIATGLLVEVGYIFSGAVLGVVIHAGIEMGWRGYLFPRLQVRWGSRAAVVLTGIVSGLWYAPLLAVGFFYGQTPVFLALALMIGFSIIIGGVLAWLRMRSGSIWPAAFAQSMISAAAILHFWFAEAGAPTDFRVATLQGVTGWILPGLLLLGLLIFARRAYAPGRSS